MTSIATTQSKEHFWAELEKVRDNYEPNRIIRVRGMGTTVESTRAEMFEKCNQVHYLVHELFSNPPKRILDLGSGKGSNTLPMAKTGAHVTAIDKAKTLLESFAKKSVEIGCPAENLRLRCGDIVAMRSYEGPFDLVVAVDVFPYIPAAQLRSTMEKIHSCLAERGILIATIFTTGLPLPIRTFMGQLGTHFYENKREFVTQLLEHSGFKLVKLEVSDGDTFHFKAEKKPIV